MFEELTPRANKIIHILAQEELKRLNHDYLTPEHILLGLIKDGDGVAVKALVNLGIDLNRLKLDLNVVMNNNIDTFLIDESFPSSRVDKVLKFSSIEAKSLGHTYIGTEHLLLGILREEAGAASLILEGRGVYIDKVRNEISRLLGYPASVSSSKNKTVYKTPVLDEFSRDLTLMAQKKDLDCVINRDMEINRLIQILCRRRKNNPILIGEPGVGKTSVVEGLAQYIVSGNVPELLLSKRLLSLDLGSIVAGTKYRGEFEERLRNIVKEILKSSNIILFIDEIHAIVGAGGAEGAIDAANMLKPVLVKGEFQCIGATTLEEYRRYFEKDSALERRFQSVIVKEPSVEEAIGIVKGLVPLYEAYHNVVYTEDSIVSAVNLSCRYINGRYLPDKAVDLIDEAGASVRLKKSVKPKDIILMEEKINSLSLEKDLFVKSQDYEKAAEVRDRVKIFKKQLSDMSSKWENDLKSGVFNVDSGDISDVVSLFTGIPCQHIDKNESDRLIDIEKILSKKLVGQINAINSVSSSIRRNRVGLGDKNRPIGSFIFLGPTGVGKTELARILAEFLFINKNKLIYVDMTEFMERHSISKIIGSPPGYIGYDEGGGVTEKIRRNPYSVVLFDEIEKAHIDVLNILLRVLDEGQLVDSIGNVINFRNTVIIMTSNIGSKDIIKDSNFGFSSVSGDNSSMAEKKVISELNKTFRPEFLNRVDDIIVFHPLSMEHARSILDLMLSEFLDNLFKEKRFKLIIPLKVKNFILEKGYSVKYGARSIRKVLDKFLINPLALRLLKENFPVNSFISVSISKESLIFKKQNTKPDSNESCILEKGLL